MFHKKIMFCCQALGPGSSPKLNFKLKKRTKSDTTFNPTTLPPPIPTRRKEKVLLQITLDNELWEEAVGGLKVLGFQSSQVGYGHLKVSFE